jgi:hypothetical protein
MFCPYERTPDFYFGEHIDQGIAIVYGNLPVFVMPLSGHR